MIHSMTAFARESANTGGGVVTVELRTVNHRYLDCNFKLPDLLRPLEPKLREAAGKVLSRGKLDCLVRVQSQSGKGAELHIDQQQLEKLLAAAADISSRLDQENALNPIEILQFPGVCAAQEVSEETLRKEAAGLFQTALASLADGRRREGEKMADLILDRLQGVEGEIASTRQQLPALREQQRQKVLSRIEDLSIEVDQNRLEQELVHLAQKADVDEELDRLEAHVGEVRRTLEKGGPCGRRLDFLMQELNREANTLSSKSTSSDTTQSAVQLKVLIEQMREQIQNIE
jgi:uncharacterized protein (TIGR00255 family)